jgi:hypothetical protein
MSTVIEETDADILELFLDGELDDAATDAMTRRLEAEPALAAALEKLRLQREARSSLFASLEATDSEARTMVSRTRSAVRRLERGEDAVEARWRWLRLASAAAALIAIGFLSGRMGLNGTSGGLAAGGSDGVTSSKVASSPFGVLDTIARAAPGGGTASISLSDLKTGDTSTAPNPASLIWSKPAQAPTQDWVWQRLFGRPAQRATSAGPTGSGLDFDSDGQQPSDAGMRAMYVVEVRDAKGRVVAVEQFNTQEEARDYIAAMSRSGLRPHAPASAGGMTDPSDGDGILIHN